MTLEAKATLMVLLGAHVYVEILRKLHARLKANACSKCRQTIVV